MKFEELTTESKQQVALFLQYSDLMNLVAVSKSIRSDLDLEIKSSPLTEQHSKRYKTCGCSRQVFSVVVPKPESSIHSMTFRCGNFIKRGRIWIVEKDVAANLDPEVLKYGEFDEDNIVAESLPLHKTKGKVSLTFPVKPNKMYQFHIVTQGLGTDIFLWGMCLDRVGFGRNSTDCISYEFDVYHGYEDNQFEILNPK